MPRHLHRLERVWVEPQIYLVTTCTHQRRAVLAADALAGELTRALREASEKTGWRVGRYVIMPDHIHFFCAPTPEAQSLSEFVGQWKRWTTRLSWRHGLKGKLWQREFHDRLLRSGESYAAQWHYVVQNPVTAGLCDTPDDWSYQGDIVPFEW
jgi:REP element-mobilizing transposase RayT